MRRRALHHLAELFDLDHVSVDGDIVDEIVDNDVTSSKKKKKYQLYSEIRNIPCNITHTHHCHDEQRSRDQQQQQQQQQQRPHETEFVQSVGQLDFVAFDDPAAFVRRHRVLIQLVPRRSPR